MTALKDTTVYRGGSTAQSIPKETDQVSFQSRRETYHHQRADVGVVRLSFTISAAGGGETALLVDLGEQDFPVLLGAMIQLAPSALLPMMASAVSHHMANLPKREADLRRKGRDEVLNKSHSAFVMAPIDNNEIEKLVHKRVTKFVEELEPKPAPAPKAAGVVPINGAPKGPEVPK